MKEVGKFTWIEGEGNLCDICLSIDPGEVLSLSTSKLHDPCPDDDEQGKQLGVGEDVLDESRPLHLVAVHKWKDSCEMVIKLCCTKIWRWKVSFQRGDDVSHQYRRLRVAWRLNQVGRTLGRKVWRRRWRRWAPRWQSLPASPRCTPPTTAWTPRTSRMWSWCRHSRRLRQKCNYLILGRIK